MSEEKGKPAAGGGAAPVLSVNGAEIVALLVLLVLGVGIVGGVASYLSGDEYGLKGVFLRIYRALNMGATVISMIALAVAIYAYMRISELAAAETKKLGLALNWNTERKQKNERWERVETYMTSLNPSDWKIAILEADNILDQVVERMGYQGSTLGERMKMIEASDFPYLEDAWTAHKTRNSIAHKGTDYELSRSDAEQTINIYHRIFKELGYL